MNRSALRKHLVAPSRLASAFDWNSKGTLMAVDISKDRIAVAIGDHPSKTKHNLRTFNLDPIVLCQPGTQTTLISKERKQAKKQILSQLHEIAEESNACGFVVSWPVESSGSPGAQCGRVLHVLDFLAENHVGTGRKLFSGRPIALWDNRIFKHSQFDEKDHPLDNWGRSSLFCSQSLPRPIEGETNEYTHVSTLNIDRPTSDDSTAAKNVLEHFILNHWDVRTEERSFRHVEENDVCEEIDDYEEMRIESMLL
jgi:RNase H-fold protein (predicted Holliday junction resolvase)